MPVDPTFPPIVDTLMLGLERTPDVLEDMASRIDRDLRVTRRDAGGWTIHDHVCHLAATHGMLNERFQSFIDEEHPEFAAYDPDRATPAGTLASMDFDQAVATFRASREVALHLMRTLLPADWDREATHPEYDHYTPLVLARHVLLHDHVHLYRAEQLWLARANPANDTTGASSSATSTSEE